MCEIESRLRLTYYQASDGPRVMIFGPVDASFACLQRLFLWMGEAAGRQCELSLQPFVTAFANTRILLANIGAPCGNTRYCAGLRQAKGASGPAFEWCETSERWLDLAELIVPIVGTPEAAHQYLTTYPHDDAIVVLSKGEYGDDVLLDG